MKTLNAILLIVGIFLFAFIIAMTVIFCIKGSIPDTLVTCVLGTGTAELVVSALITIAKKKYKVDSSEEDNNI